MKSVEQIREEIKASQHLIDQSRRLFELVWTPFGQINTDEYMPLVNKFQYRCNTNMYFDMPQLGPFVHYQSLVTKDGYMRLTKNGLKTEQVRTEMLLDKYSGITEAAQIPPEKKKRKPYNHVDPALKKKAGRPRKVI